MCLKQRFIKIDTCTNGVETGYSDSYGYLPENFRSKDPEPGDSFLFRVEKRMGMIATNPPVITFLHSLEPVTDKGTHEKDDHIEDDPNKETDTAYQAQAEPKVPGSKEKCNQPEDDRQNDADDRPCFEEPPEIFLPFS